MAMRSAAPAVATARALLLIATMMETVAAIPATGGRFTCFPETDGRKSAPDAQTYCGSLGGQLATVRNAEENSLLFSLGGGWRWIGLFQTDQEVPGTWEWHSGDEVYYTNWAVGLGEPNGAEENCAMIWDWTGAEGTWNDGDCTLEYAWCCECPSGRMPGHDGTCLEEETMTVSATSTTTVTEGPTPRPGVSPGDEVEVQCASGGNSGYHPARVHNVSARGIVVAYQHLGHLYFCAPKQWRMLSGIPRASCAEHGGISPAWGGHKCCPESCGTCGTPDCHLRPGGKGNCCTNRIPDSKACGHNGNRAPCSIAPRLPEDIAPAQRRLRGLGAAEGSRAEAPFWVQDATDAAPATASSAPTDDGPEPSASMTVQIRA